MGQCHLMNNCMNPWRVSTVSKKKTTLTMGNCHTIQQSPVRSLSVEEELESTQISKLSCRSTGTVCLRDDISGDTAASLLNSITMHTTAEGPPQTSPLFPRRTLSQPQDLCKSLRAYLPDELAGIAYQYTSMEEAKCQAIRNEKPILCFEIEIPGDRTAGRDIFSHPLVIEAAESLFVTVRQNPKINAEALKAPSTTVRVLDEFGVDVVVSLSGDLLSISSMVSLMISGLKALRKTIPTYLLLLEDEENGRIKFLANGTKQRIDRQVVFGMIDSQTGEVEFGDLDGVLATRTGYIARQRVLQITYDSTKLSYCNLTQFALQRQIADIIYYRSNDERIAARVEVQRVVGKSVVMVIQYTGTIQPDVDPKHALRQTMLKYVPLTDLQATKANRLVALGVFNEATHLLSPRQGVILMKSMHSATRQKFNETVDVPISRAWSRLSGEQSTESASTS